MAEIRVPKEDQVEFDVLQGDWHGTKSLYLMNF